MSELPRRFEILAYEKHYYIVDLNEGALFDSPSNLIYDSNKRWEDYTEELVLSYLECGVWEITAELDDGQTVEVGDLI